MLLGEDPNLLPMLMSVRRKELSRVNFPALKLQTKTQDLKLQFKTQALKLQTKPQALRHQTFQGLKPVKKTRVLQTSLHQSV
jgi:hypothetical protein